MLGCGAGGSQVNRDMLKITEAFVSGHGLRICAWSKPHAVVSLYVRVFVVRENVASPV